MCGKSSLRFFLLNYNDLPVSRGIDVSLSNSRRKSVARNARRALLLACAREIGNVT